ncbi:hypothetical protein COOONC_09451 [Cooperia oncophora]
MSSIPLSFPFNALSYRTRLLNPVSRCNNGPAERYWCGLPAAEDVELDIGLLISAVSYWSGGNVTIFTESQCPYCTRLLREQIWPFYVNRPGIMNLQDVELDIGLLISAVSYWSGG